MGRKYGRNPTPADRLDRLIEDMCSQLGFYSNRPTGAALLARADPVTPEIFAIAILRAEGMVPDFEKRWRRELEARFRERFGNALAGP